MFFKNDFVLVVVISLEGEMAPGGQQQDLLLTAREVYIKQSHTFQSVIIIRLLLVRLLLQ